MKPLVQFLLLSVISIASCNGQNRTPGWKIVNEPDKITAGQLKMRKTLGSNEYQNVHCGLQDKAGNLWFGTTGEGVYRYDGKFFTQFTMKDGLCSNTVWSILEDAKGFIWIGTDAGLCRYDGMAMKYIPFTPAGNSSSYPGNSSNNKPQPVNNAVWSIMQDKSGTIWFGADDGMYCYDGTTFTRFLDDPRIINKSGLTLKSIQCMFEDSHGIIWFGSGPMAFDGICRFDGKTLENFKPRNETWVRNIMEQKKGNILFDTRHNGVCCYDGRSFTYIAEFQGAVKGLMMRSLEDRQGNMWFASDYGTELNDSVGGVWRDDGKSFTRYSTKEGLTNNAVFLILEDRNGNIWVGTRNNGLYRFNGKAFDSYSE